MAWRTSTTSRRHPPSRGLLRTAVAGAAFLLMRPTPAWAGDAFTFRMHGRPNETYAIQASPDLVHWTATATNQADASGAILFTDARAASYAQRFYRGVRMNIVAAGVRSERLLVKPKPSVVLGTLHLTLGVEVEKTFPAMGNLQVVQLLDAGAANATIAAYQQSGLVEYAERDYPVHALAEPDDFRFQDGSLWNLKNSGQLDGALDADIDAPEAWDTITGANHVLVAVIDTGVRTTHEDLTANLWTNPGEIPGNGLDDDGNGYVDDVHGINTLNHSGDPEDDYGHGSHVSGILGAAGNNQVGVVGVCWQVQIMACKFLDAHGDGSIADAIACIDYARAQGAHVINASWGSTNFTSQALRDAIASARDAGIIFVAACGNSSGNNDNPASAIFPASYDLDNIIAVAATTRTDGLADFSNYGATTVDLAAPGIPIFSCWNASDSSYQYFAGTSMSAAHVSGAAALVRARFPEESYSQIIQRILGGVDRLPGLVGKCATAGRLNLNRALRGSTIALPTVTVVSSAAGASEPANAGAFMISRSGSTASALTVDYTLSGTAQSGTDYQQSPSSVVIAAGSSSATIAVTPLDDATVETSETVVLTLSANAAYNVGSPNSATVTIADNDQPSGARPVVTVVASDPQAAEAGDPGTFTITRTGSTAAALTVSYALGGNGENGVDYQSVGMAATIPAGATSVNVTVRPIDDASAEIDEPVYLMLAPGAGYIVGAPDAATVIIADNDLVPTPAMVTVVATDPDASESGDPGRFTISRTGDTSTALSVSYTLGGNGQNGVDYQTLSGVAVIPAGAALVTVTIRPLEDTGREIAEPVYLMLAPGAGYVVGVPNAATVTISDND